jgi:hypothetical protein
MVTRPKDENFFNINYYQKRPKSSCDYTLNEEEYIISKDDIDRLLDPPDINFSGGSRFYSNSEQSYKGKVKAHKYINRPNQSTTGKL